MIHATNSNGEAVQFHISGALQGLLGFLAIVVTGIVGWGVKTVNDHEARLYALEQGQVQAGGWVTNREYDQTVEQIRAQLIRIEQKLDDIRRD